jgi:hypothetical protein
MKARLLGEPGRRVPSLEERPYGSMFVWMFPQQTERHEARLLELSDELGWQSTSLICKDM